MDNGERWNVAWVDAGGAPLQGEPAILFNPSVQRQMANMQHATPIDGSVNALLAGRTVQAAMKNGLMLTIACTDGTETPICWINDGAPVAGEPCLVNVDVVVKVTSPMNL